jgi:hypothetical protein
VLFSGTAVQWNAAKRDMTNILFAENAMEGITGSPPVFYSALTPPKPPINPSLETVSFSPLKTSEPGAEAKSKGKAKANYLDVDAINQYEKDLVIYENKLIELETMQADRERRVQAFNQVKANALKILLETTSKSVQATLKNEFDTHDPKVIWEALNDKYGVSPVSRLSRVYVSLVNLVLEENETVAQYCVKLEDIFSTLESRGEQISDTFKLAFLKNGIEKSTRVQDYELVLAIQENLNSSYYATREALVEEDIRRNRNQKGDENTGDIEQTSDDQSEQQNTMETEDSSICEWCKEEGHSKDKCSKLMEFIDNRNKNTVDNQSNDQSETSIKSVNEIYLGSAEISDQFYHYHPNTWTKPKVKWKNMVNNEEYISQ